MLARTCSKQGPTASPRSGQLALILRPVAISVGGQGRGRTADLPIFKACRARPEVAVSCGDATHVISLPASSTRYRTGWSWAGREVLAMAGLVAGSGRPVREIRS